MGARIPPKIRKYPGLVTAWRARHGASGNMYDPPRKRRGLSPPKTSTRHKRDPGRKRRSMKRGYGSLRKKPYGVGSRGGLYWSGGRKPRYDPRRRRSYRHRAKSKLDQIFSKAETSFAKVADLVGFGIGLLLPSFESYKHWKEHYGADYTMMNWLKAVPNEVKTLCGMNPEWSPLQHIEWKFTHADSHWRVPFWASLGAYIITKLGLLDIPLSFLTKNTKRITEPIQKVSRGMLIATTIGGLILPGSEPRQPTSNPNPARHSSASLSPASMYG